MRRWKFVYDWGLARLNTNTIVAKTPKARNCHGSKFMIMLKIPVSIDTVNHNGEKFLIAIDRFDSRCSSN